MRVEKATRMINNGVVVEFSGKSVYFSENFLSGAKMDPEKYHNWSSVDQNFFGRMSGYDIKNVARQINEQISMVESLYPGIIYEYVNILPRKGNGTPAKDFVKISNARLVEKGGMKHLQGFVNGKKYSVTAKTRFMGAGVLL